MLDMLRNYSQQTETVLEASMCPSLSYEHVSRLFDIIPGMDTCHYDHNTGLSVCVYVCLCVFVQQCVTTELFLH